MATLSRRRFARLLGLSTSAAFFPGGREALAALPLRTDPLPPAPRAPDEAYWRAVRARFVLPRDLAHLNAANLCPTSLPQLEALERNTRRLDGDPSSATRAVMGRGREESRRLVAEFLGVSAEEIVLARNTSEANNLVSSGLQLGPGDEVVVFGDNHPSNHAAWRQKAERFGFAVSIVAHRSPHPGTAYYLDAFRAALTPRTRLLAFTHVTNTVGDLLPAEELCALARGRGIMSLIDGAQTFGALDVRLDRIRPDFYTGSAHKWPCGPKEIGLLYVNREVHDRLYPSVVSLYPGAVGISQKMEAMGQRDEAALASLGEAVRFQSAIGRAQIEARGRELTDALARGLRAVEGVELYSTPGPETGAAVLTVRPGSLDPRRLAAALYERDRIACAARGGMDRPGVRFSPHFYNLMEEIDRTVEAVGRYVRQGIGG